MIFAFHIFRFSCISQDSGQFPGSDAASVKSLWTRAGLWNCGIVEYSRFFQTIRATLLSQICTPKKKFPFLQSIPAFPVSFQLQDIKMFLGLMVGRGEIEWQFWEITFLEVQWFKFSRLVWPQNSYILVTPIATHDFYGTIASILQWSWSHI